MPTKRPKVWTAKRRENLAEDIDLLIGDLCTRWGFCNDLLAKDLFEDRSVITAEGFADAVLKAEGWDPEIDTHWRRKIKRAFVDRYGQAEIAEPDYSSGRAVP